MTSSSTYLFNADPRTRLRAAEELLDPGTIHLLERLAVGPGWRCLEVGAGGGSIARWLAERVGPGGQVVATDLETRHLAEVAGPNVEVRRHDVVAEPLEDNAYDLIHARLVLEHLPERDAVLTKLAQALRPGGWLMIEDVDYVSGIPISALGAAEHAHSQATRLAEFGRQGVEHAFGRQLPARLRGLGLTDVGNEGRVWVMEGGSPGARWFGLSMQHLRPRLVGPGKLTEAEVDRMLELFDDPAWSAFSPIILAAWAR
ncbi:MAG TPA: methyltransferase domain-containing protein, partial [Chloroflexota bacterium]